MSLNIPNLTSPNIIRDIAAGKLKPIGPPPARFSLAKFTEVAIFIEHALRAFPGPLELKSERWNSASLARKLREAIKGKLLYKHYSDAIDERLWTLYGDKLVVSDRGTSVWVGDINVATALGPHGDTHISYPNKSAETVVMPEFVENLCALLPALTPRPTTFVVSNVDKAKLDYIESRYDVAFQEDELERGKFHII